MNPASTLTKTLLAFCLNVPALEGIQLFTESDPWVPALPRSPAVPTEFFATRFAGASKRAANRPPSAYAGKERLALVGEIVEFYGQGASPDQNIIEYSWDFESDGVVDFVSSGTGNTTHVFAVPGDYRCLLKVLDSSGQIARSVRRVLVVSTNADFQAAERALHPAVRYKAALNAADGFTHRYAILFNGGSEQRFWEDMTRCYAMLTNRYNFWPGDIYLLNYEVRDPNGDNPNGMIDYPASLENLQTVFSRLATMVDSDDEVFFCITDHGRGYSGPLSQGGVTLGYLDGRATVDPGDEPDFPESDFKLRSLMTYGDYMCNHGLNVWKVFRGDYNRKIAYYRNKYVSHFDNVFIETLGRSVSDHDVFIERFVDYLRGDTNKDGFIDTIIGEVFDYDGDGVPPYDPATGAFDEDDWGPIDILEDDFNQLNTLLPEGAGAYKLFDSNFEGKLCIDLAYNGGQLHIDGRDEDGVGLFDWMDVNQDGDTDDIVSIDEAICAPGDVVYDDDLRAMLAQLSPAKITIVAEPCFSGGLVEDLSSTNRVICTATIEDAVSYGNLFIRSFVAALHGQDDYGTRVNADTDGNGAVSMLEAFNYAARNDYYDEIPQYDDNGDGTSQAWPLPVGNEGLLGANTYLGGPTVTSNVVNEWTRSTSGSWEEPSWSLGRLPGMDQDTVAFRNPGWKALAIGANTTATFSDSLSLNDLIVDGPTNSFNLLLLNWAGLSVPLNITSKLTIGTNGSVASYYSALKAANAYIGGTASFSDYATEDFGDLRLSSEATLGLTDGTMTCSNLVFDSATFTQSGGTHIAQTIHLPEYFTNNVWSSPPSTYYLQGGALVSQHLWVGAVMITYDPSGHSFPDIRIGRFWQTGGVHTNSEISLTGNLSRGGIAPAGFYFLDGGRLSSSLVDNTGGEFIQNGGTNLIQELKAGYIGYFELNGGELVTSNLTISYPYDFYHGGAVIQRGGTHTVRSRLLLSNGGYAPGYVLAGGKLVAPSIDVDGGALALSSHGALSNRGVLALSWPPGEYYMGRILADDLSETQYLGQLQISSGGALDMHYLFSQPTNATVVRFADSHALPWTGPLQILDWGRHPGDHIYFGTNAQALTAAQLAQVRFVGNNKNLAAKLLVTGELVPTVPPPLGLAKLGNVLALSWPGGGYELVTATNVSGPYLLVPGAATPFTNTFKDPLRFFRLRSKANSP